MDFKQRLKELRKGKGLTQKELGKMIGKTARVISYYENDQEDGKIPDEIDLKKFSEIFDVSINYLMGKKETPEEKIVNELISKTFKNQIVWYPFLRLYQENEIKAELNVNIEETELIKTKVEKIFNKYGKNFKLIGLQNMVNCSLSNDVLFIVFNIDERDYEFYSKFDEKNFETIAIERDYNERQDYYTDQENFEEFTNFLQLVRGESLFIGIFDSENFIKYTVVSQVENLEILQQIIFKQSWNNFSNSSNDIIDLALSRMNDDKEEDE